MLSRLLVKDGRVRPVLRVFIYAVIVFVMSSVAVLFARTWFAAEALSAAVAVGVAVYLRIFLDRRSVASLGLNFCTRWPWLFALGIALGAFMQLFAFGVELVLGNSHVLGLTPLSADLPNLAMWTALFLAGALAEEYPFRGYGLQNLWEEAGFWPAAIVTSLFFAGMHWHNPHFGEHRWMAVSVIAVDGVWACLSVLWTRSLWLAWGAHFAWNLFEGPILGTPVSGIVTGNPFVVQRVTGPSAFTGGAFGPEAGWLGLAAELAGLAVLYALYRFGVFASLPDTREAYAIPHDANQSRATEM
jgi:membrane protease YdiL (CAAX protease family)